MTWLLPPLPAPCPPHQVMECAHLFKSQQKAQVLAAVKGDEKYKVRSLLQYSAWCNSSI